jgi:biotin carboxyl carrier protein
MAGLPYEPVVQLSTPLTRLAVMEGRTLSIATYNSKLDDDFEIASTDPAERAAIEKGMVEVASRIEADMDPVDAAARMDTDEIVPLDALRPWLVCLVESAWQASASRRTKNPRIWGLHELEVLAGRPATPVASTTLDAGLVEGSLRAPTVGTWRPALSEGAPVSSGAVIGWLLRDDRHVAVRAPSGAVGAAVGVLAAGTWVAFDTALLTLGEATIGAAVTAAAVASDGPEGAVALRAVTDGTVWLRPAPTKPAFVEVGQSVQPNDTLALIEVMKTFSPVRAGVAGTVVRIDVADGSPITEGAVVAWVR